MIIKKLDNIYYIQSKQYNCIFKITDIDKKLFDLQIVESIPNEAKKINKKDVTVLILLNKMHMFTLSLNNEALK